MLLGNPLLVLIQEVHYVTTYFADCLKGEGFEVKDIHLLKVKSPSLAS